jgi:hypothetical protein
LKKSTTICVVVLSLFLVAAFQIHGLESAIATDNGCLLWASTYLQDELSRERAEDAIDIIAYTFAQHDEVWTEIYDGYGSLTNLNNILSKCDDFEQYHNGVSFFHYGHWWTTQIDGIWYIATRIGSLPEPSAGIVQIFPSVSLYPSAHT